MDRSTETGMQPKTAEGFLPGMAKRVHDFFQRIPESLIALVARFSIAGVFWKSGQTKIEGLTIDIVAGKFSLGMPQISDSTRYLFKEEYSLPLIAPDLAALMATFAEHLLPILLLVGLATRLSALALLIMTLTIQIFVYPGAWATHGVWAAVLLYLMVQGAGKASVDRILAQQFSR